MRARAHIAQHHHAPAGRASAAPLHRRGADAARARAPRLPACAPVRADCETPARAASARWRRRARAPCRRRSRLPAPDPALKTRRVDARLRAGARWRPASMPPPRACLPAAAWRSCRSKAPAAAARSPIIWARPAQAKAWAQRAIEAFERAGGADAFEAVLITATGCGAHLKDYRPSLCGRAGVVDPRRRVRGQGEGSLRIADAATRVAAATPAYRASAALFAATRPAPYGWRRSRACRRGP